MQHKYLASVLLIGAALIGIMLDEQFVNGYPEEKTLKCCFSSKSNGDVRKLFNKKCTATGEHSNGSYTVRDMLFMGSCYL